MVEYHLDPNLEEMANEIIGKPNRFIRLNVRFGKKDPKTFEFPGDSEELVEKLTDIVRHGECRVITQAIGTYVDDETTT